MAITTGITNSELSGSFSMTQKCIKYIGFYDLPKSKPRRVSALPATNKMDYICKVLIKSGHCVHFISPAWFDRESIGIEGQKTISINEKVKLTKCFGMHSKNKLLQYATIIASLFWLFLYLVVHTKRNERVLVYHSPWLALPLLLARFIRRFYLILEVEEIYADVSSLHSYFDFVEKRIIESADAYIFSTELLRNQISMGKSSCVLYGTLEIEKRLACPSSDGKIHLLYAGVIDSHKCGAFNAVEATRFLSANYVLHVIGFGETQKLIERIDTLNRQNDCKIVYDGVKSGADYIRYAQRCHIGLSTQRMSGKYLKTSFPSKILSYLAMGLRVVSCHIECVACSQINTLMHFYHSDTPEAIAAAIKEVDLNTAYDYINVLDAVESGFISQLNVILGGFRGSSTVPRV